MNRKLIYLYVNEINGINFSDGLSFTNEFSVYYNKENNELHIESIENFGAYFEEELNINSISLIVGKNGSGKTSILNLLGSTETERNKLLNSTPGNYWFAVYAINKNDFILEGRNITSISNLIDNSEELDLESESNFSINVHYNKRNKKFEIKGSTTYSEATKLGYLYYNVDLKIPWYSNNYIGSRSDSFKGYKRKYVLKPDIQSIFKSINKLIQTPENQFTAKNIEMKIEKRNMKRR